MLHGAIVTVELAAGGAAVSLALGALGGLARHRGPAWARRLIGGYVELIRGLPEILQLFVLYFGLTQFGIDLSPFQAAGIWMCVYGTGYAIEIFRAGFAAVPHGQHEAANALGLSWGSSLRRIVVPQAVAAMLPPLTNFVILELKNTTLVYIIGVPEVMYQARLGVGNSAQPLIIFAIAAGIYLVLNNILARVGGYLEWRRAAWTR